MKIQSVLFLAILISSCSPKISPHLKQIQETKYSNSWEKIHSYPIKYGRSDDLHFFDENTGFVINSSGFLSYTANGGKTWKVVHENEGTFFRCITFKNREEGWLGTIGIDEPLLGSRDSVAMYETKDGGINWSPVEFIGPTPKGLCGLQKVTDDFIVGCGRVRGPSYFVKTTDGGKTWYSQNLDHIAGSLIAAHFFDENTGLLIGGTTRDKENCRSMVLSTENGGTTWDTIYLSEQIGEYPWKFSFPSRDKGYISIQRNVKEGRYYHLQTNDGGKSWKEVEHSSDYYYVQGIGFANQEIGYMGGTRGKTYATRDGGKTWAPYTDIGDGFNNFQFFDNGSAYGVGFGVFKCENVYVVGGQLKKEHYDSGEIKSTYAIKDGKRNGFARTFHLNGKVASQGFYKDNLKSNQWNYYDVEGQLINQAKMKNGVKRISKKKLKSFEGSYKSSNGVIRKVFVSNGLLHTQRADGASLPIFPETNNRFYYAFNPNVTIQFFEDAHSNITKAHIFQNGEIIEITKI